MNLYDKEKLVNFAEQHFAFLLVDIDDHVMHITLNRAAKRNSLHPQMVNEIAYAMQYAHETPYIWMITISAVGSVFCAGADLKAMAGIIEENDSTIPEPKQDVLIARLFTEVHKPVIAKITGDVYAGGFFFLAGSHIVIARDDVKFGLPEVKRGLYPFQVMAALLKVMPERKVIDWCIRAYDLPVEQALQYGLITEISTADKIDQKVLKITEELKQNSPSAIRYGLAAYDRISGDQEDQSYLYDMLQKTITSKDGIEGLKAFREKRKANWSGE